MRRVWWDDAQARLARHRVFQGIMQGWGVKVQQGRSHAARLVGPMSRRAWPATAVLLQGWTTRQQGDNPERRACERQMQTR